MSEPLRAQRPALSSLATKIIAFVCICTSATAVLVSCIAVFTTMDHLETELARRLPATLARSTAALKPWREAHPDPASWSDEHRAALIALLDAQRESGDRLVLLDAEGAVLAAAQDPAQTAPLDVAYPGPAIDEPVAYYGRPDGERWVGAQQTLAGDWRLVVEQPLGHAFAPVVAVLTRVFAADLIAILVFALLGYKITSIVVRPIEQLSAAARRIAQGEFDHQVPEPSQVDEVGLLARTFNDMLRWLHGYQTQIEAANQRLTERNAELQQAKETFEQLSITDGLTKLHNHRFFQDHLTREIKRVTRTGEPLSMLLIDIDDFKQLNDRFGHAAGDELLTGLARIMNDTIRESDLLARYGGEEFVVLASDTELLGAYGLAEKIRTAVAENSFILDDSMRPVRATVSIGVARYGGNRKTFFVNADRALYRAKAAGKNCVVMDEDDDVT